MASLRVAGEANSANQTTDKNQIPNMLGGKKIDKERLRCLDRRREEGKERVEKRERERKPRSDREDCSRKRGEIPRRSLYSTPMLPTWLTTLLQVVMEY